MSFASGLRRKAQRLRKRSQLRMESLERRDLLAVVTWDGGANTANWGDATNWSSDALPTQADVVVFGSTSPLNSTTIDLGNVQRTVAQVQFTNDTSRNFTLNNGVLATANILQTGTGTNTINSQIIEASQLFPGLVAGSLTGDPNLTAPNPANIGFQLRPEAGYANTSPPWAGNTTFVYTGQIFDADGAFAIAEHIDDRVFITIDGVQVLKNEAWNQQSTTAGQNNVAGTFANFGMGPNGDGWHDIEIRMSNGGGGAGPTGPGNGGNNWTTTFGIGINTASGTVNADANNYAELKDPGNGSLLRAPKTAVIQTAGTLVLTNNTNSYTGTNQIAGGIFRATTAGALGTAGGGTTVSSGATLQLNGNFTSSETLNLSGAGAGSGALLAAGNVTLNGAITQNGAVTIGNSSAGTTLVLNGNVVKTADADLTIAGAGNVTINGTLTNVATGGFSQYRFVSTALRGPNPNSIQMAEFQLFSGGVLLTGATATNPGGNNPAAETPPNAADNNVNTKWLDFNGLNGSSTLVLNYGTKRVVNSYRIATANDATERDPISWRVEGSNDGLTWTTLDTETNFATPTNRLTFTSTLPLTVPPASGLTKTGTGTLTLTGNNSYAGTTTVNGGTLVITNANALGTNASGTIVNSGASLVLSSAAGINVSDNISARGAGATGQLGAIVNALGNNTLSGAVNAVVSSGGEIRVASINDPSTAGVDTLTIANGLDMKFSALVVDGSGNVVINGAVVGTGAVVNQQSYSDVVLADNPQVYYRLNEAAGSTTVVNSATSGAVNNGTVQDGTQTTLGVAGPTAFMGTAARFNNGANTGIRTPYSLNGLSSQYTIEAWFRSINTQDARSGIAGQNDSFEFGLISGNTFEMYNPNGGAYQAPYDPTQNGQWFHLVATGDGTNRRLFLNGQQIAVSAGAIADYGDSGFFFNIGGLGIQDGSGNGFDGDIDEVAVYGIALTPAQILTHYNARNLEPVLTPDNRLVKQGTGTLTLSGANGYNGGTTVSAGTLVMSNSTGSATGSGPVVVNGTGVLAGTGTTTGPVTASAGGAISGGALSAVGTETVGVNYQYYRFVQTALRGPNPNSIQLAEFNVFSNGTLQTGATITNPGGNNPAAEVPANANDNNTGTKWLDFNRQALVYNFGSPRAVDSYSFTTANDAPERDPVSWRVEGSLDGTNWTVLDTKTNFATTTNRLTQTPIFASAAGVFNLGAGGVLKPDITATTADTVRVIGGVTIDPAAVLSANYLGSPAVGTTLVLINNDLADPIVGTLAGVPNNGTTVLNGRNVRVMYNYNADTNTVGTGNDLAVVFLANPPSITFNPGTGDEGKPIPLNIGVTVNDAPALAAASVTINNIPYDARIVTAAGAAIAGTTNPATIPTTPGSTYSFTFTNLADVPNAFLRKDDNRPQGSPNGPVPLTVTGTSTPIASLGLPASSGTPVAGTVTVKNAAPTAAIDGPDTVGRGQAAEFTFLGLDAPGDLATGLRYHINWGDGQVESPDPEVFDAAGLTLTHEYGSLGAKTITFTVTDDEGASQTTTLDVNVSVVFIDPVTGSLIIGGSNSADRITIQNSAGGIQARINNVLYPAMSPENGLVKVFGGGGNDTITIAGNVSAPVEIFGGNGNDYLTGGGLNDVLHGEAGDDRLLGGNGDDLLLGGDGRDTINGGNGNDLLYGDADGDGDALGDFADFIIEEGTAPNADLLKGDNGDDKLFGGGAKDKLYGGTGTDELYGGDDADYLSGDAGDDLLLGEDGSDSLYGQAGNDVMIGGMLIDTLYGGAGSDLLLGDDLDVDSSQQLFAVWLQTATSDLDAARAFTSSASDDNGNDNMYGQGGDDWFIAFLSDRVRDGKAGTDYLDKDGISVY